MHVWENAPDNFSDGAIEKLFSSLPASAGIGNPSFSKNSPYIVAFDYFDNSNNAVLGVNLETGAQGTIYENNTFGYPNYSRLDDKVLFNTEDGGTTVVAQRTLAGTKITGTGQASLLIDPAQWGVWFANGVRNLQISTQDVSAANGFTIAPNPATSSCVLSLTSDRTETAQINLFDAAGQRATTTLWSLTAGKNTQNITLTGLPTGIYTLKINTPGKQAFYSKFIKQ